MALSGATPTNYSNNVTGRLSQRITGADTTGIVVTADQYTTPAGKAACTFPTGEMILRITEKSRTDTKVEYIGVESGTSQSGSTVTLGTCIRYLSSTDGTDFTSQGAGLTFSSGAIVEMVWSVQQAENTAFKNNANTFTGKQTFSGGAAMSGTTDAFSVNEMTEAQRDALTAREGMIVKNSDTGVLNQYVGGAWLAVGDTGTPTATESAEGKVELATAAEHTSGTTGARVVQAKNTRKTSSGAADENMIPVLGAAGTLPVGFLATGSPTASTVLYGDGAWAEIANPFFGDGSTGAVTWSDNTDLDPDTVYQYATATLDATKTLSVDEANKVQVILTSGNVTINGTVDLNGKGGPGGGGGAASAGAGVNGTAGTAGTSIVSGLTVGSGGAGGGGTKATTSTSGGGGGGGGASVFSSGVVGTAGSGAGGTSGAAGSAGVSIDGKLYSYLANINRGLICGGGGGGGGSGAVGDGGTAPSGAGGTEGNGGGAMLWMIGGDLTLGASSVIRANATNGSNGGTVSGSRASGGGGGGGGSGGVIVIIVAGSITNGGVTLSATKGTKGNQGTGGADGGTAGAGGDGVDGRIIIYSLSTGTIISA